MTGLQPSREGTLRARDYGIELEGKPGPWNSITDVPGVEVGYETLVHGDGPLEQGNGPVRTGVTVILPLGKDRVGRSCPAGWHSLNGNGEMTGTAWLDEVGGLSLPIGITNTHAVGSVHRGIIDWSVRQNPDLAARWHLPVVAETWDGYLNDINGPHVTGDAVSRALDGADSGPVEEGSVGGGTGMNCYAFKGGTGTASRMVEMGGRPYTVGTLMQANFGSRKELTIAGRRVGPRVLDDNPMEDTDWFAPPGGGLVHHGRRDRRTSAPRSVQGVGPASTPRPRADRHHRQSLLRRPVPRLLGDQRRLAGQQHRPGGQRDGALVPGVRAMGADGHAVRGGRPMRRGDRPERPRRRQDDGRPRWAPQPGLPRGEAARALGWLSQDFGHHFCHVASTRGGRAGWATSAAVTPALVA